jgi:zinc transport system substrate-binding protein
MRRLQTCGWLAAAIGLLIAAPAQAKTQAPPLKIVVTIKPVHALALQVLEGVAKPSLVVDGAASPHTYALKPSDAKLFNDADIVVRVSETFEPFTARVVKSLPKSVQVFTLDQAPGVKTLPRRVGTTFEKHEHAGKGHSGHAHGGSKSKDAVDGHLWLEPSNAKAFIAELARVATAKRPEASALITANAGKATARIDALDVELAKVLQPAAAKPYVVFHDAMQYLEVRYGLTPAGSITVDPEVPPSGKRLADLRKKVGGLQAMCVFTEHGFDGKVTKAITEGTSARSGVLDPEGLTVAAGPDAYEALMTGLAKSIATCLVPGA